MTEKHIPFGFLGFNFAYDDNRSWFDASTLNILLQFVLNDPWMKTTHMNYVRCCKCNTEMISRKCEALASFLNLTIMLNATESNKDPLFLTMDPVAFSRIYTWTTDGCCCIEQGV